MTFLELSMKPKWQQKPEQKQLVLYLTRKNHSQLSEKQNKKSLAKQPLHKLQLLQVLERYHNSS